MKYLSVILVLLPHLIYSQVVNTEKLRLNLKEKPFVGEVNFNLGLARNKAGQTVRLGTNGRFELVKDRARWLLMGGYNLTQFNNVDEPGSAPKNFANNAFGHLRYNFAVNDRFTWEAFTQGQYDEIQQIDIRWLAGTGPRVQLLRTDTSQLYFGLLYMFEHEKSRDEFEEPEMSVDIVHYDHRLSSYFSGGYSFSNYFAINHVTYFQPRIDNFSDFRISSETTISVKITNKVLLKTYFQFVYDTEPPFPVPNSMYVLSNGLSISF